MRLDVKKPILSRNDEMAAANRATLGDARVFCVNLMGSPGAGKTSLILATAARLADRRLAVIEGDVASHVDAVKIKQAGIPCVQINTGGICHLEAQMIASALDKLDLRAIDLLFVENVGNLVCPTDFDLGESVGVVVLSIPEGHDKPVKYPGIFQKAAAIVLSKVDTMPAFDFDERQFADSLAGINPQAPIFALSATSEDLEDDNLGAWCSWLDSQIDSFGGSL